MKVACSSDVHGRRPVGGVIERRRVPEEDVDRPQRQRHRRVGEDPQPVEEPDREDRLQQRPGQAEHQQQRGDVAEQQVLAHVGDHQVLGDCRRSARPGPRRSPTGPRRSRPGARVGTGRPRRGQRHRALRVEARRDQHRQQLERAEDARLVGDRQGHGVSVEGWDWWRGWRGGSEGAPENPLALLALSVFRGPFPDPSPTNRSPSSLELDLFRTCFRSAWEPKRLEKKTRFRPFSVRRSSSRYPRRG